MRITPALILLLASGPAFAAPPHLDDRSTAASLVESLYNAINRKEYARAWSYFSELPAKSFEEFVKGYADTEEVEFAIGAVTEEGAAGSIFSSVPVALRASSGGEARYFRGCFTVKAVNAVNQDPPYRPLMIEKGKFKKADEGDLQELLVGACTDQPEISKEESLRGEFKRRFGRQYLAECTRAPEVLEGEGLEVNRLEWRYSYQTSDEKPQEGYLLTAPCDMAAYNSTEHYYFWESGRGFVRLSFASPDFAITYADENNEKLKTIKLTGFASEDGLVNSSYDPESQSISMFSKWRGVGDASSSGTWAFREGRFILQNYEVDPSYDGEINSFPVIKDGALLPLP